MIKYIKGDIFQSTMQTLVCPVNTVGVMGAGLARQFAEKYPGLLSQYQWRCNLRLPYAPDYTFRAGMTWLCRGVINEQKYPNKPNNRWGKWIICFATKGHWRNLSKLKYIEDGLKDLTTTYWAAGLTSIAFPKLGCGLGGLDWADVKLLFDQYLDLMGVPAEIYI